MSFDRTWTTILLVTLLTTGTASGIQSGDDPPPNDPPDTESPSPAEPPSLDDLLDIEESEDVSEADAMAESDRRDLDDALAEEKPTDAFRKAVEDMQESADLLGDRRASGIGVQRLQQRIIDRLQILIDSARRQQQQQQQQSSSSSSSQQQQDPGRQEQSGQQQEQSQQQQESGQQTQSGDNSGQEPPPPEFSELEGGLEGTGVEWGGLPPRVRELISQGMRDRVSDMYRSLTEAYYRRLAEDSDE